MARSRIDAHSSISLAVLLALSVLTILMVFVEIVLLCAHRLNPVISLVFQCIKSAIWTVYFIITVVGFASGGGSQGGGGLFLVLVLLYVAADAQHVFPS